ncbi:hypothetical protein SBRY_30732 [Actinacidiphila bryophytorum]|uniref:Uncharacterized protein n=1 Tax=Actinacidiphila bryophytorum TaxID=1436133 RepID=A0A9W4H1Q0_9ACTN|nr:hypothetical protein SBRY_30732 [Actinacidiphila bryophytorum]
MEAAGSNPVRTAQHERPAPPPDAGRRHAPPPTEAAPAAPAAKRPQQIPSGPHNMNGPRPSGRGPPPCPATHRSRARGASRKKATANPVRTAQLQHDPAPHPHDPVPLSRAGSFRVRRRTSGAAVLPLQAREFTTAPPARSTRAAHVTGVT